MNAVGGVANTGAPVGQGFHIPGRGLAPPPAALSNARKYQTESGDAVPCRFAMPVPSGCKARLRCSRLTRADLLEPAFEVAVKGSPRCVRPNHGARMKPLAARLKDEQSEIGRAHV